MLKTKGFPFPGFYRMFVCLAVLAFFPASLQSAAPLPSFWEETENSRLAEKMLAAMSDTELLGQLFFLGYQGTSPSPGILNWIKTRSLGGVKIFTRNITDLKSLARDIDTMQKL